MRFMMIMLPPTRVYDGAGTPDPAAVAEMTRYNDALSKAGVLLSLDGLHGPKSGARISFAKGTKPVVQDVPFSEAKVIGGYWMIQVRSKEEAVEWARRCPADDGAIIEVRQVFEMADFPADVQAAAKL